MNSFELQGWHVLVLFFTFVVAIVKNDVISAIKSFILIYEQKNNVGKTVLLLNSSSGEWFEATIDGYQHAIPLIRSGGVFITLKDDSTGYKHEKISFVNWQTQRIRIQ